MSHSFFFPLVFIFIFLKFQRILFFVFMFFSGFCHTLTFISRGFTCASFISSAFFHYTHHLKSLPQFLLGLHVPLLIPYNPFSTW